MSVLSGQTAMANETPVVGNLNEAEVIPPIDEVVIGIGNMPVDMVMSWKLQRLL